MNGHPRARMKTILRQCEAPITIYNSIKVSQYPITGPNVRLWLTKGRKQKNNVPNLKKSKEKLIFVSIQGVQGAIWEGPEPIQEMKNINKNEFFQILIFFFKFSFRAWGPIFWGPGPVY